MTADSPSHEPCPRCRELEATVTRLTMERQNLLEQVARERDRANALVVAFPPQNHDEDQGAPPPAASQMPLRYQVADALNDVVKRALPGAHRAMRASADKGK